MNKYVLIGGGIFMVVLGAFCPPAPAEAVTGFSLVIVGLAMTGE